MTKSGSIPPDPSEHYLRLLKGEITPEDYAKSVKQRVDDRARGDEPKRSSTGAKSQRG